MIVQASLPSIECPCSTAPGEPDSPSSLEVASLTPHSAQLNWKVCYSLLRNQMSLESLTCVQDSVCHGCPVESYEVQWSSTGDDKMTTLSVLSLHCAVSNLRPATPYQARVRVSVCVCVCVCFPYV